MATAQELQTAANNALANAQAAANAAGATANTTTTTTTEFNPYDYNARIDEINRMYDSYANSQKANLESAYNQSLSDLEANRGKIAQQYQTQRNISAVNYERARRNFNQQAMMNGLNTGAGAQAALAQNNQYQGGMAQLGAAEAGANADLNKSIADLKVKYEGDVNEAIANNDYNRAAALLDEYNNAYSQAMTRAQQLAQYGDFSGYAAVYGQDNADQMSKAWEIQNPLLAYNLGRITAKKYRKITGKWPPAYKKSGGGGGGGYVSGGGKSGSKKGSKGGSGSNSLTDADYNAVLNSANTSAAVSDGGSNSTSTPRKPSTSGRSVSGTGAAGPRAQAQRAATNQQNAQALLNAYTALARGGR